MKGHLRERSPGKWAIILDTRDPATNKRRRKWHAFAGTKRQAQIECARLISEMQGGSLLEPNKISVSQYFERWLEHIKPNVSPRTYERYEEIARKNLAPLIGAIILGKLQNFHITNAYSKALTSGRRDGKGGLSARTVHHMHRVLHQALRQAVRWQMLLRNPADLDKKDRPKVEKRVVATVDTDATADLIEAARDRRLFIPILLGSMCGLRRGEITALRWRSLDLDRSQLAVIASTEQTRAGIREKETKGSRCRTLHLPSFVVEELRRHRLAQAEELLRLGVRLTDEDLIVMREDGLPLQPRSLTRAVTNFIKARGGKVRLHGLRHSHASHMLASNVHPKIVQERFGHSSIAITMDIYSHLMPNMQEDAVARVDTVMQAALKKRAAKRIG